VRYLCSAAAMTAILATASACCLEKGWDSADKVDVGVSADLNAVAHLPDPEFSYLAVGSGGTVVAWRDFISGEVNAKAFTVPGDVDLRGTASRANGELLEWWVIGDGGFAAVSDDRGETWSTVDLATTADLHAIVEIDQRLVVVGDDVVRMSEPDGIWFEPPAPVGGWGQLRDIVHDTSPMRLYAVGLGGVILAADDPSNEWVAEDSGTTSDLLAVGQFWEEGLIGASGAAGTVVVRDSNAPGWRSLDSGVEVDLIDYQSGYFLSADGELLEAGYKHDAWVLEPLDTLPGAQAVIRHALVEADKLIIVGDAGSVNVKWPAGGGCFWSKE
jgi:hypothetical protein